MRINLKKLADYLEGNLIGDYSSVDFDLNLSIDSRKVEKGDLFVCIKGENTDGHNYIDNAIDRGSRGIILEHEIQNSSVPQILVESTRESLKKLARNILSEYNPKNICITGSAGKTTTKELVFNILKEKYKVFMTEGNFNTPIGIPLQIAKIDHGIDFFISEMSASYKGEMFENVSFIKPDVAIITGIGESHLEFFGNVDEVYNEKIKLAQSLKEEGILLVNGDNLISRKAVLEFKNTYSYGLNDKSDIYAKNIDIKEDQSNFDYICKDQELCNFTVNGYSEHYILDSLPGIFLGSRFNLSNSEMINGLKNFHLLKGRGKLVTLRNGVKIIDDTYNANPLSFEISLNSTKNFKYNRLFLIMGDMLELGENSSNLHKRIGLKISDSGFNSVFYIGKFGQSVKEGLSDRIDFTLFNNTSEAFSYIKNLFREGDLILIKGSNSMKLDKLLEDLINS